MTARSMSWTRRTPPERETRMEYSGTAASWEMGLSEKNLLVRRSWTRGGGSGGGAVVDELDRSEAAGKERKGLSRSVHKAGLGSTYPHLSCS